MVVVVGGGGCRGSGKSVWDGQHVGGSCHLVLEKRGWLWRSEGRGCETETGGCLGKSGIMRKERGGWISGYFINRADSS